MLSGKTIVCVPSGSVTLTPSEPAEDESTGGLVERSAVALLPARFQVAVPFDSSAMKAAGCGPGRNQVGGSFEMGSLSKTAWLPANEFSGPMGMFWFWPVWLSYEKTATSFPLTVATPATLGTIDGARPTLSSWIDHQNSLEPFSEIRK